MVDGDDVEVGFAALFLQIAVALQLFGPARLGPVVGLGAGDVLGQIHAIEPGPCLGLCQQRGDIEVSGRLVADHAVRRALVTDVASEAARIEAGEPDEIVRLQPGIEMLG